MTKLRFSFMYLVFAVLGVLAAHELWSSQTKIERVPYSDFQTMLKDGKITEVAVSTDEVRGLLKDPLKNGKREFVATRVDPSFAAELDKHGIKYSGQAEPTFFTELLSWVLPVVLFIALWGLIMRSAASRLGGGAGLMSIGKSKAKIFVEDDTKVNFGHVAGVDEAKGELQEIVSFLKDPKAYGRLGARMPKGVLLVGPPGTGKTLLARAVAGEAGVPFFSISGSEFVEMFVGVGAARVRDLFEQARQKAPCIIFIDELDALGKARNAMGGMGGHDEKEQTLNQLLVELDGFDATSGIVLLAATNRPEILDPALLRAGRFDRQVLVDRPDKIGREAILKVHLGRVKAAPDLSMSEVAAMTPGFTGADLANLVNEAALAATRRGALETAMVDFTVAIERIVAGLERKTRLMNPNERRIVAYHEVGHALVAAATPGSDPVHKISIIPRGIGALGYTMQRPTEDRYIMTREELEAKMAVLLGGRAAEKIIFNHLSTGAADDLGKVTDIARSMVTHYAMVPELGHATFDPEPTSFLGQGMGLPRQRVYSDATAREIDGAVRALVQEAFDRATSILEANQGALRAAAEELLAQETLTEEQLTRLFADVAAPQPAPQPAPAPRVNGQRIERPISAPAPR